MYSMLKNCPERKEQRVDKTIYSMIKTCLERKEGGADQNMCRIGEIQLRESHASSQAKKDSCTRTPCQSPGELNSSIISPLRAE